MQSAYRVLVASSLEVLNSDRGDLWDSDKVASDQSVHIPYAGTPLHSRQHCFWKVQIWTREDSPLSWSDIARWEMGLLEKSDWTAKWVAAPIAGGPYSIPPAPHLRKRFAVEKQIASARLYVTALGLYEFEINAQRISDYALMPGRTDYHKRVPYHVFDVTALLKQGDNTCTAILGDGWYCGHLHSDPRQTYGDRPRLLAQLEIRFGDGTGQTVATDGSWEAAEGPIRSSDLLMGEDVDTRIEPRDWRPVLVMPDPQIELVAHRALPIRPIQELRPIAEPTVSANKRRHIFDLGQNMVGRVRLRFRNAPPGKTVDLRYAEMLDKSGKLYTEALRTARATDHYTTRGGEEEVFEPHFTFHGFRYVEVRDYPGRNPTPDDLTGIVLHSDCPITGSFTCSDPLLNKLQSNIAWSQKGNFLDIPTDCPQRDERLGWTGDAQVFIRTAAFNMDVANFFTKWLTDMADAQGEDGRIPSVVPHVKSIHNEGGPAWADAAVICPWTIYICYGDTRILEQCWPMMSRFMQFLKNTCPGHIRPALDNKWKGYGDWLCAPDAITPPDFIGTAFYAHCAQLMAKMSRVLNKQDESREYDTLAESIRQMFIKRFVEPAGDLVIKTQTAWVLALHFDLLPEELRRRAVDSLIADIASRGMHLSTGFVGTPYLLHVLTRGGRTDIAYSLLLQKSFPSWLYPITQGATTMWERWDAYTHDKGPSDPAMNSYNHYAFGAVGAWMYSTIAGIDLDERAPGYKHIIIHPRPGAGLASSSASFECVYGLIKSEWNIENDQFRLEVRIPPNTTGTVNLPDGKKHKINPGEHAFSARM